MILFLFIVAKHATELTTSTAEALLSRNLALEHDRPAIVVLIFHPSMVAIAICSEGRVIQSLYFLTFSQEPGRINFFVSCSVQYQAIFS